MIEFAKSSKRKAGGSGCWTCKNERAKAAIHAALEVWADDANDGEMDVEGLHKLLVGELGYKVGQPGMRKHLQRCEHELYQRVIAQAR